MSFPKIATVDAIDIGSGPNPADGYVGLDPAVKDNARVLPVDVLSVEGFPFESGQIKRLRASHFIEHIPALDRYDSMNARMVDMLVWFFEECYRVACTGAVFEVIWPALRHENAFRDPTHRRFLPLGFVEYLSEAGRKALGVSHYDFRCNWVLDGGRDVTMVVDAAKAQEVELLGSTSTDLFWGVAAEYHVRLRKE